MRATGIVRKVDDLGRVCLPKEIRRTMKLGTGDPVEFFTEGDKLLLRKFDAAGDMEQLLENMKHSIELADPLIPGGKSKQLLAKVDEMMAILVED